MSVHPMEHELSAFYDVTHGEGLAVLTPAWMRYVLNEDNIDRFVEYGVNVWGIDKNLDKPQIANMTIDLTEDFFANKMNIPMSLSKLGIGRENFEKMSVKAMKGKDSIKGMVELRPEDVVKIYEMCL